MSHPNPAYALRSKLMIMITGMGFMALGGCGSNSTATSGVNEAVTFAADVAPILNARCIECHSGAQASGQLDLSSYQKVMLGGGNGIVVEPGHASQSLLIEMVQSGGMPMGGAKLSSGQIQKLVDWINNGAKDD